MIKAIKYGVIALVILVAGSWLVLGKDAWCYARTKISSWRQDVRDSVPIETELQMARDLLDEIVPQMHANIRIIAKEEVELANLNSDISRSQDALDVQQAQITKLTELMSGEQVYFSFGDRQYSRNEIKGDLSNRFERYKEAQLIFESKKRLALTRETSLRAAIDMLDQARNQKILLEQKISALDSQNRLLIAASANSGVNLDNSALARTDKMISRIKKRLDVAERVLAHEGRFVETIDIDVVDESDLLSEIHDFFSPADTGEVLTATD